MRLFNPYHTEPAYPVSILDWRDWNNKDNKKTNINENHKSEAPADLNTLLIQGFKKSPHIKEALVENVSFEEFRQHMQQQNTILAIMYKVYDPKSNIEIAQFVESYNSAYPDIFFFIRDMDYLKDLNQDIVLSINEFYLKLQIKRFAIKNPIKKTLILGDMKPLDDILQKANYVLADLNRYKRPDIYTI